MDWDHLWKAGAKMLSQVNNPKKLLINPPPGPPPIDSNASGTSVELLSVMSFWHLQGLVSPGWSEMPTQPLRGASRLFLSKTEKIFGF